MSATPLPVAASEFVAAMGQHVSSVCVITTAYQGQHYGLTATAMSSVCAAPPRLLVCINTSGLTHEMVKASGVFCVNVLGEDLDKVAKSFAGMLGRDFNRFSVGEWHTLVTGAPALLQATAVFDCKIVQVLDQFSHTIFIGEVLGVSTSTGRDPLLYGARRFRTLRKAVTQTLSEDVESLHF